jgi:siroheme synthase-like protein
VSPTLSEDCARLLQEPALTVVPECFVPGVLDAHSPDLVFACTSDSEVNRRVVAESQQRGIWVNSATEGASLSDFIVPALTEYEDLQIALFSGGASPLLIRKLREDIESLVGPWMGPYLQVLKTFRNGLQAQVPDEAERKGFYEKALADETLLLAVQSGNSDVEALSAQLSQRILPR